MQAFLEDKLVGWATLYLEKDEEATVYMNLLVVDPCEWKKGIGSHLVFYALSNEVFPHISTITLLLRKINEEGRKFYEKIGFVEADIKHTDYFVDNSLLVGLQWKKHNFL